ncbi:MAG: AMP-binding protein [Flavobacteriales bacterium]
MYKILAWLLRGIVRTVGRTVYRLRIRGVEHIPARGGALLVANHASYMDFVLLVSSVPRYVRFVMNADVYHKRGLHWIMKGMSFIPISPRGGSNDFEAFNTAVSEQVNAGFVVVIFAEGTVTRTGQLLEFKKGVEHLSARISAPVIPLHFDNVQGTPFTFRGGRKRAEKFSFKTMRREVLVNIGQPMRGKISAFMLRQKMKEMEVENFNLRISSMKTLDLRLADEMHDAEHGRWKDNKTTIGFESLPMKLAALSDVLGPLLKEADRAALMLPKSCTSFLVNLWLLMQQKVVVNISPDLSNEERLYVCNKAKVKILITTRDLHYTRFAPNADVVLYIEDLMEQMEKGKSPNAIYTHMSKMGTQMSAWFSRPAMHDDVVAIFFQKKNREEMRCVSLTHRNFLSVITSLRQVYHFEKGSKLLANIDLSNVYGFVLELLLPIVSDLKLDIVDAQDNTEDYVNMLQVGEPDLVLASPAQLQAIAALSQVKNIPYLKTVFTADVPPDDHALETLSQRGVQVMRCAGLMETTSIYAVNIHNYQGRDIAGKMMEQENYSEGSIGKPIPGVALKVCDPADHTRELLHDEAGTLWVKGPGIAPAKAEDYECVPKLVDGWYNTGLSGSVNHKGFVYQNA